jgi:group II intron reverse transcriptase/maturase
VSTELQRVREVARKDKDVRFTALMHHVTPETLKESFYQLKRNASPGVDGVTWAQYQENLEERLAHLHERIHQGTYHAQPSRRVYIPKQDGRLRPLGVAALEDKIVQHAVGEILSVIYEEFFLGFSYGFRPGRSQHDALDALSVGLYRKKVNWVLDADIQGFFDTIPHEWMLRFLEHRIADKRILRLVRKWLRAGVSEDGEWSRTKVGTPQGAVISPLLANIFLHYVFDLWAHRWRQHARGEVIIVRFADDTVLGFQHRQEAQNFLTELRVRLEQFGLTLHPEKTRLIEFGRYAAENRRKRGEGKPEPFDFLGFTHICDKTRERGWFMVRRQTVKKRLRATLERVRTALRRKMHDPISEVGRWLRSVVLGYDQYHAIPGNGKAIRSFREDIKRYWYKVLRRRGQKRRISWRTFGPIVKRWIPAPKILHPYPLVRFDAKYPR